MTSGKHTLTPLVILRFQFIKPDYGGFLALNISAYEGRSRISNRLHIGNIFAPPSPWISMLLQTPAKYHGRRSEREYINCSTSSTCPIGGIRWHSGINSLFETLDGMFNDAAFL